MKRERLKTFKEMITREREIIVALAVIIKTGSNARRTINIRFGLCRVNCKNKGKVIVRKQKGQKRVVEQAARYCCRVRNSTCMISKFAALATVADNETFEQSLSMYSLLSDTSMIMRTASVHSTVRSCSRGMQKIMHDIPHDTAHTRPATGFELSLLLLLHSNVSECFRCISLLPIAENVIN